jgi:hypothetical protein
MPALLRLVPIQPSYATGFTSGLDHTLVMLILQTTCRSPQITNSFVFLLHVLTKLTRLMVLQVNDHWFAVIFALQPTTVVLSSPQASSVRGDTDYRSAITMDVPAGVTKLRCPLVVGGTIRVQLERGGSTVMDYVADGFVFNGSPPSHNFNVWVGWKAAS